MLPHVAASLLLLLSPTPAVAPHWGVPPHRTTGGRGHAETREVVGVPPSRQSHPRRISMPSQPEPVEAVTLSNREVLLTLSILAGHAASPDVRAALEAARGEVAHLTESPEGGGPASSEEQIRF
jgi:hypothetical protein